MQVYIALGSNLQHPKQQIKQALAIISEHPDFKLLKLSSLYQSPALIIDGSEPQADYINAVILIETPLSAHELLNKLQQIEYQQGRVRGKKWGARTLDLDILMYDDVIMNSDTLIIPHQHMCERNFVMYPLAEISPTINIPNRGHITELLSLLNDSGLTKL